LKNKTTVYFMDGSKLSFDPKALCERLKREEQITTTERRQICKTHYYAQVSFVDGLANFSKWDNCRLYLKQPVDPEIDEVGGCLGIVWLHNPTKYQGHFPHHWGRVDFSCTPGTTTLTYVIPILQSAFETALGNGFQTRYNPHVNIEELVYLGSGDRKYIWNNLTESQVQKYSHSHSLGRANVGFRSHNPKFIWLAWGDLSFGTTHRDLFNSLVRQAQRVALTSGADVIFVAALSTAAGEIHPTFRWSRQKQKWLIRWNGQMWEHEHAASWNLIQHPVLHPERLRKLTPHNQINIVKSDLGAAISGTID